MSGSARTCMRAKEMILPDPDLARSAPEDGAKPEAGERRGARSPLELWELRGWDEV